MHNKLWAAKPYCNSCPKEIRSKPVLRSSVKLDYIYILDYMLDYKALDM